MCRLEGGRTTPPLVGYSSEGGALKEFTRRGDRGGDANRSFRKGGHRRKPASLLQVCPAQMLGSCLCLLLCCRMRVCVHGCGSNLGSMMVTHLNVLDPQELT